MKKLILILCIHWTALFTWASPHAPIQVGTSAGGSNIAVYGYDAAGNRLSDGQGQTIVMGLRGKPKRINQDEQIEKFRYGPSGGRYLRVHADGSKTFYLKGSAVEYRVPASGDPSLITYIRRGGYSPIAQVDTTDLSDPKYAYYLRDHLGSPLRTVDDAGNPQPGIRHDPWGQPTDASGVALALQEEHRAFTGHENIASANLIHMNGRVYDPAIGQFLGPDPVIQSPGNLLNLTRYSYINHNPLGGIDPSGLVVVGFDDAFAEQVSNQITNQGGGITIHRGPLTPENQPDLRIRNLFSPEQVTEEEISRSFNAFVIEDQNAIINNVLSVFTTRNDRGLPDSVYNIHRRGSIRIAPINRQRRPAQFVSQANLHVIFMEPTGAERLRRVSRAALDVDFDRETEEILFSFFNPRISLTQDIVQHFSNTPVLGHSVVEFGIEETVEHGFATTAFSAFHLGHPVHRIFAPK